MSGIDGGDERLHQPGSDPEWAEAHRLDLLARDADDELVAVSAQLTLQPNRSLAGFSAAVLESGQRPVVISELDVPFPAVGLEVRASGLWAEFVCETPLVHWSYGLEAFALAIDEPDELLGRAVGERVPLGWELEFEAGHSVEPLTGLEGYRQVGVGHGLLLTAAGERELDGVAVRSHGWGDGLPPPVVIGPQASSSGSTLLTESAQPAAALLPDLNGVWTVELNENGLTATAG